MSAVASGDLSQIQAASASILKDKDKIMGFKSTLEATIAQASGLIGVGG